MKTTLVPGIGRIPCPAYHGSEPYLFISYAHKDSDQVFGEIERLNDLGYHVWYDEGIAPGNEWPEEIARALEACSLFVVMLSPNAAQSKNVANEIHFALDENKPFTAVYLQETKLSSTLHLQIAAKPAIRKYDMSEGEYVRTLTETFQNEGLSPAGETAAPQEAAVPSASETRKAGSGRIKLLLAALLILAAAAAAILLLRARTSHAGSGTDPDAESSGLSSAVASAVQSSIDSAAGGAGKSADGSDLRLLTYAVQDGAVTITGYDMEASALTIPDEIDGMPVTSIEFLSLALNQDAPALSSVELPDSLTGIGCYAFARCRDLREIVIPAGVTVIDACAFWDCAGLTALDIPDSVANIGSAAFSGCAGLSEVRIPGSVAIVREAAFNACSGLRSVSMGEGVVRIGDSAFCLCTGLESVSIPATTTMIGLNAFYFCSRLTDVYYGGTPEQWESILIDLGNEALTGADIHYSAE